MAEKGEASCTIDELLDIITAPSGGFTMMPSTDLDEVYPNLYIGDASSGKNLMRLEQMGFTHVLNTAMGPTDSYHINTSQVYYKKINVEYLGVKATDTMNCQISELFQQTSEFIDQALKNGGKVLVHCREGVSRSATTALAFLMMKRHQTAQDATRSVRAAREICPNDGFLQQLCDLNDTLTKQGHFSEEQR